MLESVERKIGGKQYRIRQLAAEPGRRMLVRLMKLLGPSAAAALRNLQEGGSVSLQSLSTTGLADAIVELCSKITEDEFEDITKRFLQNTEVMNPATGGYMEIEPFNAFAGDYGSLFKLLSFHLEFNYSSFLGGLGITGPQT